MFIFSRWYFFNFFFFILPSASTLLCRDPVPLPVLILPLLPLLLLLVVLPALLLLPLLRYFHGGDHTVRKAIPSPSSSTLSLFSYQW